MDYLPGRAPTPRNWPGRVGGDAHVYGDKLGGAFIGSEAYWEKRAGDAAPAPAPAAPPLSDAEQFLACVEAVNSGTDAEAAAACMARRPASNPRRAPGKRSSSARAEEARRPPAAKARARRGGRRLALRLEPLGRRTAQRQPHGR